MTFSGFLENQAGVGRGRSTGPTTGLGETIGASFDFTWKAHTTAAAIQYQGMPLNERNDQIKQRFGQDIYDITGLRTKYTNPTAEGRVAMAREANEQIDNWILKGRTEAPEKYQGIKTSAEIREEARKTVNISENHMNEVMVRNPSGLSRMTGGFIGGMGATLLDPPNLLTLPLGAGEVQAGLKGWAAARAILKAGAIDGSINAAIEATSQPAIMAWQKELGRRYGFGDAAENVAFAFAGGAGLSAALRGVGRGANYLGSASMDVLDKIARSERLPASVRNAASFMSRQAHIDESAPPGAIKTGEDLKVHRDTAQKIADEFESYKPPSHNDLELKASTAQAAQATAAEARTVAQPASPRIVDGHTWEETQATGKELTMDKPFYHGTDREFTDFDPGKIGDNHSDYSIGFHFSEKKMEAKSYGKNVVQAELDIKNPLVIRDKKRNASLIMDQEKANIAREIVASRKAGKPYDAVVTIGSDGRNVAVFSPGQIKRVDGDGRVTTVDKMDDIAPTERIQPTKLPEGLAPEVSADRVAIAESDMKALVDEIGDETITLDDGRAVSIKDFAEEIQAKKKVIEAMKTCRIA